MFRFSCTAFFFLLPLLLLASESSGQQEQPFDILFRGGTLIDGTGKPRTVGDVGVRDDRIVFIGKAGDAAADTEIDASGLIVAPGFIDPHNHSLSFRLDEIEGPILNKAYLLQGVTTIVEGPDGYFSSKRIQAIHDMASEKGIGTNYAFYVGHNGTRREVMGTAQRAPTEEELAAMKTLVREGMEMGAVGFSAGLMYEPGMFSETAEVIALAREVKPYGGIYDAHARDPVLKLIESQSETIEIGRAASIPAKLGHLKTVGLINKGKIDDIISLINGARAEGIDAVSDQYPYDGAATAILERLIILPGSGQEAGQDNLRDILTEAGQDPRRMMEIRQASEEGIDGGFSWIKAVGYGSLRIVNAPDQPELVGRNIQLLADEKELDPFELVVSLILGNEKSILATLGAIEESEVRKLLVQPWNMVCSDGAFADIASPNGHPRSTGSFPRVLGHYSRDLGLLTLEEAVRKMTSLTADTLRLYDRGRLEVGKAADITVFDADRIIDKSTWTDPGAFSEGVVYVLVNGEFAVKDEQVTGETPGQWIKRQSPSR